MASTKPCQGLLRRPLPPIKRDETNRNLPIRKGYAGDDLRAEGFSNLEVYNSLIRQATREKSTDLQLQEAKMKQYGERLKLLLFREKPKGIYPFPLRSPKRSSQLDFNTFLKDSYEPPPPVFTLDDFLQTVGNTEISQCHIAIPELTANNDYVTKASKKPVDRTNILGLEKKLKREFMKGQEEAEHSASIDKYGKILLDQSVILPELPERKPMRQQYLEERLQILESLADDYYHELQHNRSTYKPSVARPTFVSKNRPKSMAEKRMEMIHEQRIPSELFTEQDANHDARFTDIPNRSQLCKSFSANTNRTRSMDIYTDDDRDLVLVNSPPMYFQGDRAARSPSPFEPMELRGVFPTELAVLDCAIHGGTKLSLKAHFIDQLPDVAQISKTLTHINLSFNDFSRIPTEICQLTQLQSLKLRNNPVREIPREIENLKRLRIFVLSFCCISSLPPSLFKLESLEIIDLSYNKISFIPEEIKSLKNLQVLNVEGNQLSSFPRSILELNLRSLNVANNFTHPLLWNTTAPPQPQPLLECCATFIAQTNRHFEIPCHDQKLDAFLNTISLCDFCGGPKFGQGIRVVKPAVELFGVKNLPIIFHVCSQNCRSTFRVSDGISFSPEFDE